MTPGLRERVWDLFDRAAALPPGERAPFLEGACAGDAELRAEVESLLAHDCQSTTDNGDGILQWNANDALSEVHVDSVLRNFGTGIPRDIFSIQTGVDLLNRRLRIQTLFDYKGGYSTQDGMNNFQCNSTPFSSVTPMCRAWPSRQKSCTPVLRNGMRESTATP